ncbi:hypothetical protein CkaCkLH20_07332 [Colletotrichum karsti]|uniref:Uncharacterized protein n=1 Tax=Colletotrichum karsti TaxID=1095194 RepID=A0A9P6I4V6_9PEZI|nr:uncharacterized protein CkaCkLH20_07332 [Colletotrichum karsti]KAF9875066.1 hypothetical protein CkaCkLH20_07332 [Colletotrichum karsti]
MVDHIPSLPWEELASNFTYIRANPAAKGITDLFPQALPTLPEDLNSFILTLTQKLKHDSSLERSKYAETYDAPDEEEVLIDDETVREITPFFRRLHKYHPQHRLSDNRWPNGIADDNPGCRHPAEVRCRCLIPYEERKVKALTRTHEYNTCFEFWMVNGMGFRGWEIVRTLLVHGKMEPLLRLCKCPFVDSIGQFPSWWDVGSCVCEGPDGAMSLLYEKTAMSFICLQLLRHHPQIQQRDNPEVDYRLTRMYQHTVRHVTKDEGISDLPNIAHRDFYGIGDQQFFTTDPQPRDKERWVHLNTERFQFEPHYPEGLITFDELLNFEVEAAYRPHGSDVAFVQNLLYARRLPTELVDEVLDLAEYQPGRRLKVAHDPLHPGNSEELDKYLEECWAVMVRCEVFAAEFDEEISWIAVFARAFRELLPSLRLHTKPGMVRSDDGWVEDVAIFV